MTRGAKFRSGALVILAAAGIVAFPAPAGAANGPAAVEEYELTLPGVETSNVGQSQPLQDLAKRAGPVGVTGERKESVSTLGATADAAPSAAGLALVAVGAAALWLALRRRRRS